MLDSVGSVVLKSRTVHGQREVRLGGRKCRGRGAEMMSCRVLGQGEQHRPREAAVERQQPAAGRNVPHSATASAATGSCPPSHLPAPTHLPDEATEASGRRRRHLEGLSADYLISRPIPGSLAQRANRIYTGPVRAAGIRLRWLAYPCRFSPCGLSRKLDGCGCPFAGCRGRVRFSDARMATADGRAVVLPSWCDRTPHMPRPRQPPVLKCHRSGGVEAAVPSATAGFDTAGSSGQPRGLIE